MTEQATSTVESPPARAAGRRWFHFRWKALLVILLLIAVPVAYLGWRQNRQQQAIADLKERGAIVRTEPVPVPFLEQIAGKEFSQQIIEVYWVNRDVSEDDLQVLSRVGSLRKLELTNSKVDAAGLRHITGLRSLYTLHLTGTNVGDDALQHVSKAKSLEILTLNGTKVTNDGLSHLSSLAKLQRLFLNGTSVTDAGLDHVAGLTQLKELGLKNLPITDVGLAKLKALVNLELLALDNNPNISREGMLALRETIPRLVFSLDEQSGTNPASRKKAKKIRTKSKSPNE